MDVESRRRKQRSPAKFYEFGGVEDVVPGDSH